MKFIKAENYEFTVQSTTEQKEGSEVKLYFSPNSIHVMKKLRSINEFIGKMTSENTVEFCGGEFEVNTNGQTFEKGDDVKVKVKSSDIFFW